MQFSLRSLFIATAGVAVLFAVACTLPDLISIAVMVYITLILPGATIALIVYGRGYVQAFAIGCAVSPVGPAIFAFPYLVASALPVGSFDSDDATHEFAIYMKIGILVFHFMNISCGFLAVATRWLILRAKTTNHRDKTKVLEELVVQPILPTDDEPYAVIHGRVGSSENGLDRLELEHLTREIESAASPIDGLPPAR